jgi:hypothetical protein
MLIKTGPFNLICTECMRDYDVCSGDTLNDSKCFSDDCPTHEIGHLGHFSPGNWQVEGNTLYVLNEDDNNRFDATIRRGLKCAGKEKELEANLALMSAAPVLVEALVDSYRLMLTNLDPSNEVTRRVFLEIEHALTKANINFKQILELPTSMTEMIVSPERIAA